MNWKLWRNWFSKTDDDISADVKTDSPNKDNVIGEVSAITTVYITENLLERTRELLASFANHSRSEGIVYWFGFELGEQAIITTLIVPDADTKWGCIRTSPQANAQALSAIIGTPLMLLGQAHSHPGEFVRHSETDDKETFASFDGAISVVVPHFGRESINLETCGIHRHINRTFQYIEPSDISEHIKLLPGEADFRVKIKAKVSKNISKT